MVFTQIRANTQLKSGTIDNNQIAINAGIELSKLQYLPITYTGFVSKETMSGSINTSNTIFMTANTPYVNSEQLFLNGLLQEPGVGNDYTVSGNLVVMEVAPNTGDRLKVSYLV